MKPQRVLRNAWVEPNTLSLFIKWDALCSRGLNNRTKQAEQVIKRVQRMREDTEKLPPHLTFNTFSVCSVVNLDITEHKRGRTDDEFIRSIQDVLCDLCG